MRSLTPSDINLNHTSESDNPRSPLAKRKKISAERSGFSKLKEGISADELANMVNHESKDTKAPSHPSPLGAVDEIEEEEETDDDADDEDDFLARELEDEWG